jgi:elongation factor G
LLKKQTFNRRLNNWKKVYGHARHHVLNRWVAVEVETPEDFIDNMMGDLSSRRGLLQGYG